MAKETTKDAKNSTEQEKIPVNDITDKGLISKIYTQLIQLTTTTKKKKQKIQSKKKKKGGRSKQACLPRRHPNGQKAREKMLNTANF